MSYNRNTQVCDVCEQALHHGSHRCDGHKLRRYGGIMICDSCWERNNDGWPPYYEELLIQHLERQGIPIPRRNDNGLLPRD